MAKIVVMPRLGNTVESCVIVSWNLAEGDTVRDDTVLCEIETDKATMDVPAGVSGTLLKKLKAEGDDVPVLEAIAVVGEQGEDWRGAVNAESAPKAHTGGGYAAESYAGSVAAVFDATPLERADIAVSPRAKILADAEHIDTASIRGTGPGGRVIERDVLDAVQKRNSESAVVKTERSPSQPAAQALSVTNVAIQRDNTSPGLYTETKLKSVRKIIADRMMASLASGAQLTLNTSANAEAMLRMRARFKESGQRFGLSGITIGDLVLFAVSRTLPLYPALNAHISDDTLRSYGRVHLGVAIDTPRGLMVPVVRSADDLSLLEISHEVKRLAAACADGTIRPDELSGSTFTVSNLGAFGIETFTPIINAPETGILGVCAIRPCPAVPADGAGSCGIEHRIALSLTIDHRALDGADGARFLQSLTEMLAAIDIAAAQ